MKALKSRIKRLESQNPPRLVGPPRPTTLDEIRAIEKQIAAIEAEMKAAGKSEAEIKAARVEPSLDVELEALEAEIARLEAEGD